MNPFSPSKRDRTSDESLHNSQEEPSSSKKTESSSPKSSFWDSIAQTATGVSAGISNTMSQAGKAVAGTVEQMGAVASQLGEIAATSFSNLETPEELHPIDWTQVSEDELLAFYGALFAIAAADGSIDPDEANFILPSVKIAHLSDSAKLKLGEFKVLPPPLKDCLETLSSSDVNLRWTLLFYLVEIALIDNVLAAGEQEALQFVQNNLEIKEKQVQAIQSFVRAMKEIASGNLSETQTIEATKQAVEKLKKAEVPVFKSNSIEKDSDFSETKQYYSENGFWEKITDFALVAGREVVEKALILFYVMQSPSCPAKEKAVILGALGYFILPFDLAPDFIPGVGFSDDFGALLVAFTVVASRVTPAETQAAQQTMDKIFGRKN